MPEREAHDANSNPNVGTLRAGASSEPQANVEPEANAGAENNAKTKMNAGDIAGKNRDMEADEDLDGVDVDENNKHEVDVQAVNTADATGVAEDERDVPKNTTKKAQANNQSNDKEIKEQRGRTHTKTILELINHTGCLTKFLDKEYGNLPRPDKTRCTTCRNCLDRGRIIDPEPDAPGEQQAEDVPDNTQSPSVPEVFRTRSMLTLARASRG
ncbi:hypothetical protein FRC06_008385, partial [Ceratobasidium sp. 370]